jgi:hypothetical protein
MKITVNIETVDLGDLARIAAALGGEAVTVTQAKPSAKAAKSAEAAAPAVAYTPAPAPAPAPVPAVDAPPAAQPEQAPAVPTEADLIAAANAAVGKLGVGGPELVKSYIAAKFTKADGSPGTLKLVADDQRSRLLKTLQDIGTGTLASAGMRAAIEEFLK